jgi:hypothetical protein
MVLRVSKINLDDLILPVLLQYLKLMKDQGVSLLERRIVFESARFLHSVYHCHPLSCNIFQYLHFFFDV